MSTRLGVMLLSSSLSAQMFFSGSGKIQARPGVDPAQFTVEVGDQRTGVGSNGRFEFHHLPNGTHNVRVLDERGTVVAVSTVQPGAFAPLELRVSAGIARVANAPAASVSVESLRLDPDGKAEVEFNYALWYANTKDWKGAAKHFDKALKIDERHTRAAANWAAMEVQLGNHAHAEEIARKGLKYAPSNGRLLHALGVSLLGQGKMSDEAVEALSNAGKEIPKVLLMAAQAEYLRGNWERTRELADAYLGSGEREFRAVAERLKNGAQAASPAHRANN